VRDDIAREFARVFYERMLDGETFGDALREARRRAWELDRACNTWGAYQAYGDPDYRLDPTASRPAVDTGTFVDAAEFLETVTNLGWSAEEAAGSEKRIDRLSEQLDELVKACPVEWLARTDVLTEIGIAYGEVGGFEAATRYLTRALEGEGSENRATLHAVEQIANFQVRIAETIGKEPKARNRARQIIASQIERLSALIRIAQTGERLSLLGSAQKRLAALQDSPADVRKELERAADSYRKAHLHAAERKGFDPYPVLNWLTVSALLGALPRDMDLLLDRAEAAARERFAVSRDFFDATAIFNAGLVRALAHGDLAGEKDTTGTIQRLEALYRATFRYASPTPRQLDSVATEVDRLAEFVVLLAKGAAGSRAGGAAQTVKALQSLRARIGGSPVTGEAGSVTRNTAQPETQAAPTERKRAPKQATPNKGRAAKKPAPAKTTRRRRG